MPRTVSASEAKTRFGAIADWAAEDRQEIIVESHGQPRVVIISYDEYLRYTALREEARRRHALDRLRALRDAVRQRNLDLDEVGAQAVAQRLTDGILADEPASDSPERSIP